MFSDRAQLYLMFQSLYYILKRLDNTGNIEKQLKTAENADPGKYVYSVYGIGFDFPLEFPLPDSCICKSIIIFGVYTHFCILIIRKKLS